MADQDGYPQKQGTFKKKKRSKKRKKALGC
jgi:hypothetical protein